MDAKVCEGCGGPLNARRSDQRYHGAACRNRALRHRKRQAAITAPAPAPVSAATELEVALEAALSESRLLAYIARAATREPNGWRAAAWLLERRYPERWAATMRAAPVPAPADDAAEQRVVERWLRLVPPTSS